MAFPQTRNRRLRASAALRSLVRETKLSADDLIAPVYVIEGAAAEEEIASMPGVFRWPLDRVNAELERIAAAGIKAVLLFGIPAAKDAAGTPAFIDDGIVQRATRHIKRHYPELLVIADTCLCQYTEHGHCGVVHHTDCGAAIDNDESLELIARTAVSQAGAGADIIAPSNMMDGFVRAVRAALDEAGFTQTPIMSYAVKFASAYYGPFREAAHSAPQFGDRKTYQMDPANAREALREARADAEEGADFLMVKPGLAYLDIVRALRERYDLPIVTYNVSGEYAMVKAAARNGWVDEQAIVLESLLGMKRAGADLIITYHAKDVAGWLREN